MIRNNTPKFYQCAMCRYLNARRIRLLTKELFRERSVSQTMWSVKEDIQVAHSTRADIANETCTKGHLLDRRRKNSGRSAQSSQRRSIPGTRKIKWPTYRPVLQTAPACWLPNRSNGNAFTVLALTVCKVIKAHLRDSEHVRAMSASGNGGEVETRMSTVSVGVREFPTAAAVARVRVQNLRCPSDVGEGGRFSKVVYP